MKKYIFYVLLFMNVAATDFNQNVQYTVTVPQNCRLGMIQLYGISDIKTLCSAADFTKIVLNNNSGNNGVLTGATSVFQLAPCGQYGTRYWNPLAIIAQQNKCYVQQLLSLDGTAVNSECQNVLKLLAEQSGQVVITSKATAQQKQLMNQLATHYSYVANQPSFQSMYNQIKEQAQFLITMNQNLQPNQKAGQDFLSLAYLRFAAAFSDQFITSQTVDAVANSLFGDALDVADYFPNNSFPITLDLTAQPIMVTDQEQQQQTGSAKYGGALVRAKEQGYSSTISAQDFFNAVDPVSSALAQKMIQLYSGTTPNIFQAPYYEIHQALLHELFFLHLALMQPLKMGAGIANPSQETIRSGGVTQEGNTGVNALIKTSLFSAYQGSKSYLSLEDWYTQCFMIGRYIRGLYLDQNGQRAAYAPQPVDTFYGVIVINNGYSDGQQVTVSQNTTGFPGASYQTGQTGLFKVSGGVDQWAVAGINQLSGLKYRSIGLTIAQASGEQNNVGSIEIQIEEGSGGNVSNVEQETIAPAGIALVDNVNNTRTTLTQTNLNQQFFDASPACPWAIVLEIANQKTATGTDNQPTFTLVGIARLSPQDFPLQYQAVGISQLTDINPISSQFIISARSILYNSICLLSGTTINTDTITTTETNMNFIKFNGALAYQWGGATPLKNALTVNPVIGSNYLQQNQTTNTSALLSLVTNAIDNPNPSNAIIPVATKSFALIGLTN